MEGVCERCGAQFQGRCIAVARFVLLDESLKGCVRCALCGKGRVFDGIKG
jgi:hypothetical protein